MPRRFLEKGLQRRQNGRFGAVLKNGLQVWKTEYAIDRNFCFQ